MVLIAIGLYVRVSLAETPVFRELAARQQIIRVPIRELLRHQTGPLLLATGPAALGFMLTYGLVMLALPMIGAASDRWGRRRVCLTACVLAAAWAFPFIALVTTAQPILIAVAFIITVAIGIPQLVTMGPIPRRR